MGTRAPFQALSLRRMGPLLVSLAFATSSAFCNQGDTANAPPHLTDEQNRIMPGHLDPAAETQSRANALYAKAMTSNPGTDPEDVLDQLKQVAALDPHFVTAQVKIGELLLQLGQTVSALDQLKAAQAANPDSVAIEAMLSRAKRLHGDADEALRLSQDALSKDPNQAMAMRVMLELANDQRDLENGVGRVEAILKKAGANVPSSTWLALASLYIDLARSNFHTLGGDEILKTLLPIYQQAATKQPPEVEPLVLLSDTYHDLGQKREALKVLKQAEELEPSNVDLLLRAARLENELGQQAEAIKDYEQAYALNPSLPDLREMLVRLYLDTKRFDDAATLLHDALSHSPHDPILEVYLGIAYAGAGQPQKAEACFHEAFASPACTVQAYLNLVVFDLEHKDLPKAGKLLVEAHLRFPKSPTVELYEAIRYRYQKDYDNALKSLAQMRALSTAAGASPDIHYYLESALVLNLANKKDSIDSTLREGLARYPTSPDLMNELAYFWADRGDHLSEALVLGRRALALAPDNGAIQDTCGWIYFKMGSIKDALPYLQRAAVLTENDPVVLQHLGDTYLKLDRRREALAAWRQALKKDPANHDLINRIDAAMAQANHAHPRSAPNK